MEELSTLVERSRAGDLKAYSILVRRFQDMAVGYAQALIGDFHLAQDAAQEAFIRAYLDLRKLREPAAFPGWFRRIVFKQCDRITRKKGLPSVSSAETWTAFSGERILRPKRWRGSVDFAEWLIALIRARCLP